MRRSTTAAPARDRAGTLRRPVKSAAGLLDDLRQYARGRAEVRARAGDPDPWVYPCDWTALLEDEAKHFSPKDERGIPQVRLPGAGVAYLPSRVAAYALCHWNRLRDAGDPGSRAAFLACADWFRSAPDGRFLHAFDWAGLRAPWLSGLAQGQGLSVLARAHLETGDGAHLDQAGAALGHLLRPVAAGGVLGRLPDGREFVEEYPGARHAHVMNGCMTALVGLHDLARAAPGRFPEAEALFARVLGALVANLEDWDVGGWSAYDLPAPGRRPNPNTVTYHALHVALLRHLHHVSGEPRLGALAERWEGSLRDPRRRLRALAGKVRYRLAEGW